MWYMILHESKRSRDVAGLNALDPGPLHLFPRGRKRALRVDGATGILDYHSRLCTLS
jgi:hypothetical protein